MNGCQPAYHQNSCPYGQYLVLANNAPYPVCKKNPCYQYGNGYVPFGRQCYKLNEAGPCQLAELGAQLSINEITLEIECQLPARFAPPPSLFYARRPRAAFHRDNDADNNEGSPSGGSLERTPIYPKPACFRGSRRAIMHKCQH